MADIELILRMFAFAYIANQNEITQKQINLVKYLNQFMKRNDNFQLISEEELTNSFYVIMQFLVTHFDEHLFRNGKYKDGEVVFSKKNKSGYCRFGLCSDVVCVKGKRLRRVQTYRYE